MTSETETATAVVKSGAVGASKQLDGPTEKGEDPGLNMEEGMDEEVVREGEPA